MALFGAETRKNEHVQTPLSPDERRRIARALLAYARGPGATQKQVAVRAGVKWTTLKGQLLPRHKEGPDDDMLLGLTRGLGLPREFALDGWRAIEGWEPGEVYDDAMEALSAEADESQPPESSSSEEEEKTDDADG